MFENIEKSHPADCFLYTDSVPSVWCPGCGIGTVINTFIQAVEKSSFSSDKICVVSGMGCTGKAAEYLKFNSFNKIDGNLIEYAAKFQNSDRKVVVFSNNADFLVSGAKDLAETGKNGIELLVIHVNNIIYTITEYKAIPNTPFVRTSADGNFELPFNIPHLAKECGATYVARWTPLRAGWLMYSMIDTLSKRGFSVIEVISPCLIYYPDSKRIGDAAELMKFYDDNSVIKHGEPTEDLDIRVRNKIILGKFVDKR
ncbi:MAG: thiamine pyrophosphate-dependent enzyme [bacterium]